MNFHNFDNLHCEITYFKNNDFFCNGLHFLLGYPDDAINIDLEKVNIDSLQTFIDTCVSQQGYAEITLPIVGASGIFSIEVNNGELTLPIFDYGNHQDSVRGQCDDFIVIFKILKSAIIECKETPPQCEKGYYKMESTREFSIDNHMPPLEDVPRSPETGYDSDSSFGGIFD